MKLKDLTSVLYSREGSVQFAIVYDSKTNIAKLGLWDGEHSAFRIFDAPTLDELFISGRDIEEAEWYVDEYNDLRCNAHHHDGTNRYLYRQIRSEIGPAARRNFYDKIQSHTLTRKDINHYTLPIGQIVLNAEQRHYE